MNLLALVILLPLLPGVLLSYAVGRGDSAAARGGSALVAGATTLAALGLLLAMAPRVFDGQVLLAQWDWVPDMGLAIGLRLDGLALLFGLLITGMGALIVLYATRYLGPDDPAGKFFGLLMLFMAAMLGIALSDNLLLLVVFWELTSVSSFLLVGYWGQRAEARAGARMALAVTGGGGLAMLAGVVLLGQVAGTYDLSKLLAMGDLVRADGRYPLILVLVLLGCFTKSAQWPFHFWLPAAMAAPTPVSAYLHSATMVKAGVFLIARLHPVLGGTELFQTLVCGAGLTTLAFAAWVAIFKHDLKGLLAYSTISHLGLIVFLLGIGSPLSALAAVFHVLNHATFKAALFMTAGIVDHETGTRDMRDLGRLWQYMPWTATLAMVAAASMAGVPLVNGFLSKEMFLAEAVALGQAVGWWLPALATLAAAFSAAYALRFVHDVFFSRRMRGMPNPHPHEPPWAMKAPVALLAVTCVVVGLLPAQTFGPLVGLAAAAVLQAPAPAHALALWHGFNLPLAMSALALAGGALLYTGLRRRLDAHADRPGPWAGQALFTAAIDRLFATAGRITDRTETGSLQRNVALLIGSGILAAAVPFFVADHAPLTGERAGIAASPLAMGLWALTLATGAAVVLMHRQRFIAVVLSGVVGLITALTFQALSAPDLALTQLSVEVVSTVLLLMGLALLPATSPRESSGGRRMRDAALALCGGGGIAWLTWLVLTRDHDSLSWFYAEQSLPGGGGANVVNVILVDFRGYDTFGEITVLAIAAIAVLAVLDGLRLRRDRPTAADAPAFLREPLMLRMVAQWILPLALAVSVYIYWRGHNQPGGGFIAGLITAAALVLQYMARGQAATEARLRQDMPRTLTRWLALGLGTALLTGVGAFLFGRPFLTSAHGHPSVPLLGELPLASAALFDLGVYIVVVAATVLMLSVLGAVSKEPPARSRGLA